MRPRLVQRDRGGHRVDGDGLNPRSDEAAAAGQPQAVSRFMAAHDRDWYLLRRNLTFLLSRRQSVGLGIPFQS